MLGILSLPGSQLAPELCSALCALWQVVGAVVPTQLSFPQLTGSSAKQTGK